MFSHQGTQPPAPLPRFLQELLLGLPAAQTALPLRGRANRSRYRDRERRRPANMATVPDGSRGQSIIERDQNSARRHQIEWPCSDGDFRGIAVSKAKEVEVGRTNGV